MDKKWLIALALVGAVDSISHMVVAPSIVFYVLENGGTKEQYGIIVSAFSFASFCGKPFLGYWSDKRGFRLPYLVTLAIAAIGGFLYLIADAYSDTKAVSLILTARLLGGIGAASGTLGFAYLAKMVPHEEQTQVNSLLSMVRIVGLACGPGINIFLAKIDMDWFSLHVSPLNSVGLILMGGNIVAITVIYFLLDEPEIDNSVAHSNSSVTNNTNEAGFWECARSLVRAEILVPMFGIFSFNAAFQLIETAFAPAASHALGWTPVAVSGVLGSLSIIIFLNMLIVSFLSARKVRDETMILFGSFLSVIGYTLVWDLWRWHSSVWNFIIPIFLGVSSFPFLAAPTRSVFTKGVDCSEVLSSSQGSMQAILSMCASVAGFTTPGLVAAYVLQMPEEVESSLHHRELSLYALVAPFLMFLLFLGILAVGITNRPMQASAELYDAKDTAVPSERTSLMESQYESRQKRPRVFSPRVEAHRRLSAQIMGMTQTSMYGEHEDADIFDD